MLASRPTSVMTPAPRRRRRRRRRRPGPGATPYAGSSSSSGSRRSRRPTDAAPPPSGTGASPRLARPAVYKRPSTSTGADRQSTRVGPTITRVRRARRCGGRTGAGSTRCRSPRRWPGVNRQYPSCEPTTAPSTSTIVAGSERDTLALEERAVVVPAEEARLLALAAARRQRARRAAASARVSSFVCSPSGNATRARAAPESTVASMYD